MLRWTLIRHPSRSRSVKKDRCLGGVGDPSYSLRLDMYSDLLGKQLEHMVMLLEARQQCRAVCLNFPVRMHIAVLRRAES